ncbi:putative quinol monooxygenase [Marinoscillum sp.]|uniref:putative quinol monooxygenase n=1 Tax=Marinoscillum sp. TaxID=2024838 RepID=UPI003BAC3D52
MKIIVLMGLLMTCAVHLPAQDQGQKVRLARLVIDSTQLDEYKALLKEGIEASVRLEPGVLTLYAVSEKEKPNHFTILEIYASESAYQAHIQTEHFLKYKNGTLSMVQSLELIETNPLVPQMKIK